MNVGLEQGWVDSFLECYTNPSLSTQPSSYSTWMNVGLGEGWVGSFSECYSDPSVEQFLSFKQIYLLAFIVVSYSF